MNLRASPQFKAGSFAKLEALLVPRLLKAAAAGAKIVMDESQTLVPVDTGELKASSSTSTEWVGRRVTGYVRYSAPYAAYVEYGTGQRGAASAGAGPFPYNSSWPGMPAQPYIRPALDSSRVQVLDVFRQAIMGA